VRRGPLGGWLLRGVVATAIVAALVAVVPRLTGTSWGPVGEQLEVLTLLQVTGLVALWLAGLWVHTYLATAALPGLTHRQALALNLSGSAVSNVLPFGGVVGTGLNYAMVRSWGVERSSFAPFAALTNLWNILVKLALPLVAFGLLLSYGALPTDNLRLLAEVSAVTLGVVLTVVALVLGSTRSAVLLGRTCDAVAGWGCRLARSERRPRTTPWLVEARRRTVSLLGRRWPRMLAAMVAYVLLQALLLEAILVMLGSTLSPVAVFAGFAFGRVLTLLVVTPGGVGLSETGSAALLVALGGDAATTTAAVLLFGALTYALEIPVGAVCGLVWWRRTGRRAGARLAVAP
jgi:putative heme transporter